MEALKMDVKAFKFNQNDIYLVPIGDIHLGDRAFTHESRMKLEGYVKWIRDTPNAYAFLMGDLINCATLNSPSNPFDEEIPNVNKQIDQVVQILTPIKSKILGAITGNHEERLEKYSGYNPTCSICQGLGVYYFKSSGIVVFRLGCRKSGKSRGKHPRASFIGYFHHTTGGGSTIGGKLNRSAKLREVVSNCDFYCGGHNHSLTCSHNVIFKVNETTERVDHFRQMIVTTGGYLDYPDSYAEAKMLPPLKVGSPRIHLFLKWENANKNEVKKDIHVSL